MKLYLDTGNIDEIREALRTHILDGVTTNPTLIRKSGRIFEEVIKEIATLLTEHTDDFTVSAEVTAQETQDMLAQARELAKIDPHIIIKVPLTPQGLAAVHILAKEGIRTNVTLCFSANQALLAAKAGAWCVSPFIGRKDDVGEDGIQLIKEIRTIYDNYGYSTRILAASIRSLAHVKHCALAGADICTIPYVVYQKLFTHPLTDKGLDSFNNDWKLYQEEHR